MIQLLFTLLAAEVAVASLLLVKTPLRKLAVLTLDRVKRGRGPVMVRTIAGTVAVVLASSVYSMLKIQWRTDEVGGVLTPTDQVLWSRHFLEASLMGYSLFLALVIDRMHHYVKELRRFKKNNEAMVKQIKVLEDLKSGASEEVKAREKETAKLKVKLAEFESGTEAKLKEAKAHVANALALTRQSEGIRLEYDRLLEENENLRSQLKSIDHALSRSGSKKNL